ncbi:MAG: aminotransferase class V-fold PLP-dependent enzyme [Patescibacteria group bacterium]
MKHYPLFYPYIPRQAILKELRETLSGRYLGQGPKVNKFEEEFNKKFGYQYSVFLNSGTSALELAYHLIGIKSGDEVIVPVLDAPAGQVGLVRRGAKIVFVDIERGTLNLDPDDLQRNITPKTKAIVAVHLGGVAVNKKVFEIAKERNIPIIVDLAQDMDPQSGKYGDYLIYSFQAIKAITTADGGMLVVRSKAEYDRAKKLRWFGIDREKRNRNNWKKREMTFNIEEAGYKFQPTDIDACFGLAALPDLDKVLQYRAQLANEYRMQLATLNQVRLPNKGSNWLFCVLAEQRDQLAEFLVSHGVETNLVHVRNDIYKIFGGNKLNLPNMNWVASRYLCLPINPKITKADVRHICAKISEFYLMI